MRKGIYLLILASVLVLGFGTMVGFAQETVSKERRGREVFEPFRLLGSRWTNCSSRRRTPKPPRTTPGCS